MAYIRCSLRGTLATQEVWSVNPVFSDLSSGAPNVSPEELSEAAGVVRALTIPTSLRTIMSSTCALISTRLEYRNSTGALIAVGEDAGSPQQGTGTATKPLQTSAVISLRTGLAGGSRRGRLYWPALGATITASTTRLSGPAPAVLATDAALYLKLIEDAISGVVERSFRLAVRSPTLGLETAVTALEIGDILDVQRRRRDKLLEGYETQTYPAE